MKKAVLIFTLFISLKAKSQQHILQEIWETDTIIPVPESILPDFENSLLYISLINGGGWNADGIGGVGKINTNGKNFDSTWITGLNAPKGLGRFANRLYVADISEVVVIDIRQGKIEKKIPVTNATGLNDITVDNKGIVYVSDSKQGKIWRIVHDVPALYLDHINGANGLKAINGDLIFAEGKLLKKANAKRQIVQLAELPQSMDGIEPVGNGDFIVTAWMGYIFYVTADGHVETLLNSSAENMNTADIGFDKTKRISICANF